jgi:serine protease inhibitor
MTGSSELERHSARARLVLNEHLNPMRLSPVKATALLKFFRVGAIALLPAVFGCGDSGRAFVATPEVKSAVADNNAFAIELYQRLKDQSGNLIFSPYSISTASAMTYAGARGQTEKEMAEALHFTLSQEKLHSAFGSLASRMGQVQHWNRITLIAVNGLWGQQNHPFRPAFLDLIRTHYHAAATLVDFKHAEAVRAEINSWVEDQTKQKIKDAIRPGQLDPDTRSVLCSAIYFNGKWANPFDVKNTRPRPFYLTREQTVTVPMMIREKAEYKVKWIEGLGMLELPYVGDELSMIIFLPDSSEGLPELEQQLTPANLSTWLDQLHQAPRHKTSVLLPRFKTMQEIDLKKELSALGVPSLFNQSEADLSGMTGQPDLYISDAVQKAFIEVNESGTEAAAVTWFQAKTKGMLSSFRANHPFLFLIRENQTGIILFLGRIVDPTR